VWRRTKPAWFTDALVACIPTDMLPVRDAKRLSAQAPGGRRSTVHDADASLTQRMSVLLGVSTTPAVALAQVAPLDPAEAEVSDPDSTARTIWGVLSTIPFLYILFVLFVELGRSLDRQSAAVRKLVDGLRYIILATWGIYPLAYIAPSVIDNEATAEVVRQVGYAVGDVLAKPLFGLLVLGIALAKSREDGYAPALEEAHAVA
jgi:hypothetical protein